MPTYEYVCSKCDHSFEVSQSITADALTTCPKDQCGMKRWGKGKVSRRISGGAGLLFKGSGFYITDYRSDNYKAGAKAETAKSEAPKSEAPKSDTAKTEAKPAKAEAKGKSGGKSKDKAAG